MKTQPIGCQATVRYPLKNRTGVYEMECDIDFSVLGRIEFADDKQFQENSESIIHDLRENMSRFLQEAMETVWEKPMPMNCTFAALKQLEAATCEILKTHFMQSGLQLADFRIMNEKIKDEDRQKLFEREDRDELDRLFADIIKGMTVDENYKPWKYESPATSYPAPPMEPHDCSCGAKNISGKFCPECGKPL